MKSQLRVCRHLESGWAALIGAWRDRRTPKAVRPAPEAGLHGTVAQMARAVVSQVRVLAVPQRGDIIHPRRMNTSFFCLDGSERREVPGMDAVSSCRGRFHGSARVRRWFDSSRIHHLREQASFLFFLFPSDARKREVPGRSARHAPAGGDVCSTML